MALIALIFKEISMSYDTQVLNARHFYMDRLAGANAAMMSILSFPYPVIIRALRSTVVVAHDAATGGWKLTDAADTDLTAATITHGTDAAETVEAVDGLALAVAADTAIKIVGLADAEVGVQHVCIEYEIVAGQVLN